MTKQYHCNFSFCPSLMKLVKLGHLIILTFSQLGADQGWLLIWCCRNGKYR